MNNIYGQPNNYYDRQENSYTRPSQQSRSRNEHCECNEERHEECHEERGERCEQLGGTVLRIDIPAGTEINVLNLVELASPSGICLILRLPFLGGECK
jgi:hypothetical protein